MTQNMRHEDRMEGCGSGETESEQSLDRQRRVSDNWDETSTNGKQRENPGVANMHSGGIKFHFVFVSLAQRDEQAMG